jgi:hypothetical protein
MKRVTILALVLVALVACGGPSEADIVYLDYSKSITTRPHEPGGGGGFIQRSRPGPGGPALIAFAFCCIRWGIEFYL